VKLSPQSNVDEIRNVAEAKTVYQVAHCATENQTQSRNPQHVGFRKITVKQKNGNHADSSNQSQQESLIYEKAECGAGISYIG